MSALAGRLSPVIHKALLANGVQLTHKELGPVSKDVAAYVTANFDAVSEEVKAELAAKQAEPVSETSAPEQPWEWKPWKKKNKK